MGRAEEGAIEIKSSAGLSSRRAGPVHESEARRRALGSISGLGRPKIPSGGAERLSTGFETPRGVCRVAARHSHATKEVIFPCSIPPEAKGLFPRPDLVSEGLARAVAVKAEAKPGPDVIGVCLDGHEHAGTLLARKGWVPVR